MPNVIDAHERNFERSKKKDFVELMVAQIRAFSVLMLRIHAAGDFYSARYIRKWIKIVRQCRRTTFFAYTRSWVVPDYLDAILELAKEPNVELWLSSDRTMPEPPRIEGVRTCYLMEDDSDQPPYEVDLVFRESQKTVMKKTDNGSLVCPFDNGITPTNCTQCGICYKRNHERVREAGGRETPALQHNAT